jgi:hypothetical protein
MYTYIYIYIYFYMYVYIYIYIYMYTYRSGAALNYFNNSFKSLDSLKSDGGGSDASSIGMGAQEESSIDTGIGQSVSFIICMLALLFMPLAGLHLCVGLIL